VILTIDGDRVKDVRDVQAKMLEVTRVKAPVTIFHVRRGIRTLFVEIQPSWSR
jgi:hypothetical protein